MSDFRLYEGSECGKDGYPLAWHATLKHEVRALAGNRCVRCKHPYENGKHGKGEWTPCDSQCSHKGAIRVVSGLEDGFFTTHIIRTLADRKGIADPIEAGRVEAPWRILTVHHLDGNKRNCRWWNLAPLCQRCHLEIQGRVKVDQVYPWEHSAWFRSYAAGFYAFSYLGEDLTREEVASRMEELLDLERIS